MDDVHIYVYGVIGDEVTAKSIQEQLARQPTAKNVFVHISSPGGGVYEGWTIGNILSNLNKNTTALVEGYCASIATYIALSCNTILMAPTGRWLIHKPEAGIEGDADDMREGAARLDSIQKDLVKKYQSKTKQDLQLINDWVNAETEFTTDSAIEYGFVDGIMEPMKAVAKADFPKQINMTDNKDSVKKLDSIIDRAQALVRNLFKHVKNMLVELEDGTRIFVQTEDGEFVGKPAFTTDAEGNPTETPAPDGDHRLRDGRTITVQGGIVTSVAEAMPDDTANVQALKAENEALRNEIAAITAQNAAAAAQNVELTNTVQEAAANIQALIADVNNLKSVTMGSGFKAGKVFVAPANKDTKKDTPVIGLNSWATTVAKNFGVKVVNEK